LRKIHIITVKIK